MTNEKVIYVEDWHVFAFITIIFACGLVLILSNAGHVGAYTYYANYTCPTSGQVGINEYSWCMNCTNGNANALHVPTNTSAEWTAAWQYPPALVSYLCCGYYGFTCSGTSSVNYTDGCNNVTKLTKQNCTGTFCADVSNQYHYSGCSGSSCTTTFDQNCPNGNTYCSDSSNQRHWTGCSSTTCQSAADQYCPSSTTYCSDSSHQRHWTGCPSTTCQSAADYTCVSGTSSRCSGNDLYNWTGCSGITCQDTFSNTCTSTGQYCSSGTSYNYAGCSSSSCASTLNRTCYWGSCSVGYCTTNALWTNCSAPSQQFGTTSDCSITTPGSAEWVNCMPNITSLGGFWAFTGPVTVNATLCLYRINCNCAPPPSCYCSSGSSWGAGENVK